MTVDAQIPGISALPPPSARGCKKFDLDALGDHVSACTTHQEPRKHDWAVEQLADLFRTTHKVKTQGVFHE